MLYFNEVTVDYAKQNNLKLWNEVEQKIQRINYVPDNIYMYHL